MQYFVVILVFSVRPFMNETNESAAFIVTPYVSVGHQTDLAALTMP